MFPYFEAPAIRLGPVTLHAFGMLVAAAILLGRWMLVRRAEKRGLEGETASRLVLWMVACGLMGAHLVAVTLTDPRDVLRDPLVLIRLWEGLSSVGGMVAGMLAGLWWMRRSGLKPSETRAYLDLVAFVFPFAWILGRAGCAVAHDHPGIPTQGWWAVQYPDGPRFDLGLLEFFYALFLAGLFRWLDRHPRRDGFYLGLFLLLYGPVRFFLDELRVGDARYLGFTPAQYGCVAAVVLGGVVLWKLGGGSRRENAAPSRRKKAIG